MNEAASEPVDIDAELPDGFLHSLHQEPIRTENSDRTNPCTVDAWHLRLVIPDSNRNKKVSRHLRRIARAHAKLQEGMQKDDVNPTLIEQQFNATDNALSQVFRILRERVQARRVRQKNPEKSLVWLKAQLSRLERTTERTLTFATRANHHKEGTIRDALIDAVRLGILFAGEIINTVQTRQDDFWTDFSAEDFLDLKNTRNLIAHAENIGDEETLEKARHGVQEVNNALRCTFFPTDAGSGEFKIPGPLLESLPRVNTKVEKEPKAR